MLITIQYLAKCKYSILLISNFSQLETCCLQIFLYLSRISIGNNPNLAYWIELFILQINLK